MGLCRRGLGLLIVAGTAFPWAAMSTEMEVDVYPKRPITLVVGFPPGDSSDVIARHLAHGMAQDLGQKVIVENRPGAAGNLGAAAVAVAKPDGYTVYLAVRPVALHKTMYREIKFDFSEDFVSVGMVAGIPYVLLKGKHVAADGMEEALALARTSPGKFTCATGGISTTSHLLCELLQEQAGVSWWHVPYRGAVAALHDVIGGRADFCVVSLVSALPHLGAGEVSALAVFLKQGSLPRRPCLPGITRPKCSTRSSKKIPRSGRLSCGTIR
jgi:tripartite-type tricarboxylate transporter receptor subunit TctC